jgi:hypothetical protein
MLPHTRQLSNPDLSATHAKPYRGGLQFATHPPPPCVCTLLSRQIIVQTAQEHNWQCG